MRLLLVEDEALIREMSADHLVEEGYDVLTAKDGMEAARLLQHPDHVEALLTDVRLGGWIDGIDVVELARLRNPGIPVLVVSGYAYSLSERLAALNPPLGFLQKPYGMAHLSAALSRVINE
nr:response regulator [uncultured Lichenicoccus sp.]